MDKYETTPSVLNVAETCAASISIDDLIALCEDEHVEPPLKTSVKLTYGPFEDQMVSVSVWLISIQLGLVLLCPLIMFSSLLGL
jgi:hypothetical protein